MTPTQRNFKKEMHSFDGNLKEDFRTTRKRPTFSKGISIISIIFLLWNGFALLTWISPSTVHKITNAINPNSTNPNQLLSSTRVDFKTQKNFDYFEKLQTVNLSIQEVIDKINQRSNGQIYSKDLILDDINKLTNLQTYILTLDDNFKNLESIELEMLSMLKLMLTNLYQDKDLDYGIELRSQNWDKLRQDKTREMINILDENGFEYEVNEDGSLQYRK